MVETEARQLRQSMSFKPRLSRSVDERVRLRGSRAEEGTVPSQKQKTWRSRRSKVAEMLCPFARAPHDKDKRHPSVSTKGALKTQHSILPTQNTVKVLLSGLHSPTADCITF